MADGRFNDLDIDTELPPVPPSAPEMDADEPTDVSEAVGVIVEAPEKEDPEPKRFSQSIDEFFGKAKCAVAGVKAAGTRTMGLPAFATRKVQGATSLAHKRVNESIGKIMGNREILERAGFKVERLDIELGIPPKLTPRFAICRHLDAEERAEVLAQVHGKRMLTVLLKGLFEASDLSRAVEIGDLELGAVEVELGSIPRVRLLYQP